MSSARRVAFNVLQDVSDRDAYANLVLQHRIAEAKLSSRDAAFATELTAGTLRMLGTYDRIIELASKRKPSSIDSAVLNILRLGAHQLLNTRVAKHAAVNETVVLAKKEGYARASGFVNAVMRRVGEKSLDQWHKLISSTAKSKIQEQSQLYSHPEWIIEAMRDSLALGGRENELTQVLTSNNLPPKVSLVQLTDEDFLSEDFLSSDLKRGPSPIGFELDSGDPHTFIKNLKAPDGKIRVQDQGSQIAALALIGATPVQEHERWLDLCAGPGGKTAVMALKAEKLGIKVDANEVAEHRADLVRDSVRAFSDTVTVKSFDGRDAQAFSDTCYERILVDAPCTGLGALRRRPEARWRKQNDDLLDLCKLQSELLQSAANHVSKNGVIAYVTCSPHLSETRNIVDSFLEANNNFAELNAREIVNQIAGQSLDFGDTPGLSAQLWPHRHATDAMFISVLQRKS